MTGGRWCPLALVTVVALVLSLAACGAPQQSAPAPDSPAQSAGEQQKGQEDWDMIQLTIGQHEIFARLEDNPSAAQLRALLDGGAITMSATNYGGFEKVCSLGTRLTANDVQTTAQPGDIMLYSKDQLVIFYGSNRWAYTRLAKVVEEDIPRLSAILSGNEGTVVIQRADCD